MLEGLNFTGKLAKDKEVREGAIEWLQDTWKESIGTKFENEVEKNKEEINKIGEVKKAVNEELASLGLEPNFELIPDEVHIISPTNQMVFSSASGAYNSMDQNILLIRDNKDNFFSQLLRTILSKVSRYTLEHSDPLDFEHIVMHESFHKKSHHKYGLEKDKVVDEVALSGYRVGYKNLSPKGVFFWGFNEAIVEATTMDIKNRQRVKDGKDIIKSPSVYWENIDIVDKVAEKIAALKGETKEEVWKRFKTGQFTGNMMHLRDVEKAFGPGSLRVLASMPDSIPPDLVNIYFDYFSTDDPTKRQLAGEVIMLRIKKINEDQENPDSQLN